MSILVFGITYSTEDDGERDGAKPNAQIFKI